MNSVVSLFHHGMDNFEMVMDIGVPQEMGDIPTSWATVSLLLLLLLLLLLGLGG